MDNPIKASFERNNQKIREESLEVGRAEGEDMLQQLYEAMLKAGRGLESIVKETSDKVRRKELFKQYGITPA
ncbi:MAG: hypothetical protein IJ228_03140 [Succinivibrio sp.]|nr:hypothetical protein [Succinivibrio sp.]